MPQHPGPDGGGDGRTAAPVALRLVALIAVLIAGLYGLARLGHHVLPGPPSLLPSSLLGWAQTRPPSFVLFGLVRLVALGLGWYLLVLTIVATVARTFGRGRSSQVIRRLSVPALRPLLATALGLSVGAAALAPPAGASERSTGGPLMVRLPDGQATGPSASTPSSGGGSASPGRPAATGPPNGGDGGRGSTQAGTTGRAVAPGAQSQDAQSPGSSGPPAVTSPGPTGGAENRGATPSRGDDGPSQGGPGGAGHFVPASRPPVGTTPAPAPTGTGSDEGRGVRGPFGSASASGPATGANPVQGAGPAQAAPSAPASPGVGQPAQAGTPGGAWTTQPGDSFWTISARALQEAGRGPVTDAEISPYWALVVAANRDRLANPVDPDMIYQGQVFVLPPLPSP